MQVHVDENNLSNTTSFTYHGCIVTPDGGADKDIKTRQSKARDAFISLKSIWKTIGRTLHQMCPVCPSLCWRMTEKDILYR
jgi:hypothetical protein